MAENQQCYQGGSHAAARWIDSGAVVSGTPSVPVGFSCFLVASCRVTSFLIIFIAI